MKNIHLIPTDKPSRLRIGNNGNFVFGMMQTYIQSRNDFYTNHHIYITSEEEDFNENDYVIKKDGRLVQVSYLLSKDLDGGSKVVIASDPDLIADGVQAIDDEFLEWFVKNPSCEWVEVKSKMNHPRAVFGYEIIVQKEEIKVFSESGSQLFFDEKGRLIKEEPKKEIIATKQQTAVEWLVEELYDRDMIDMTIYQKQDKSFEKIIEQALEMEKEQIIDAYDVTWDPNIKNGNDYYNETYKK